MSYILPRQYLPRRSTSDIGHSDVIQSKEPSAEAWQFLSDTLYRVLYEFRASNVESKPFLCS